MNNHVKGIDQKNSGTTSCIKVVDIPSHTGMGSKLTYRSNGELIENGTCVRFDEWVDIDDIHSYSEYDEYWLSFFDYDIYEKRLANIRVKTGIYVMNCWDTLVVGVMFGKDIGANNYKNRKIYKKLINFYDDFLELLISYSPHISVRMEESRMYVEVALAEWDEKKQRWNCEPEEIKCKIISFIKSIFREDSFDEDKLALLKL